MMCVIALPVRNGAISLIARTPEGATVDFTGRYFNELEGATVFVVSGVTSGGIGNISLKDWDERDESQMSIVQ